MSSVERWGLFELELTGAPASDTAVSLRVTFERAGSAVIVDGFWDGGDRYLVRFSPDETGTWRYRTSSDDPLLDDVRGEFEVVAGDRAKSRSEVVAGDRAQSRSEVSTALDRRVSTSLDRRVSTSLDRRNRGPVGVASTFHFAHADGTPYRPVGTTVYNWVHQPEGLYRQTLDAVAEAGFNKLRFLVFPQGGGHVAFVPPLFPFERDAEGRWRVDRPIPEFFRGIDRAVADLLERGVQADVIVFHPYDRGEYGLDGMSPEEDDAYVRYLIARIGAYRNVWWSLANEYDQLERPEERWDRVFETICDHDPYGRLRSIHNWIDLYDYNKPWVTHASLQNEYAVADFGRASLYRDVYRKPIVMDEIKYEGDIPERWGHLSARELVHRFWIATVSGVYASHGESFLTDDGTLHIVIGGEFRGESPARLAFLRSILEEVDGPGLDPIDKWDDETSTVGIPRRLYLQYLGLESPASWDFALPQGVVGERLEVGDRFTVDIIDTWNMTVEPTGQTFALTTVERNLARADGAVPLPPGEALALRVRRVD